MRGYGTYHQYLWEIFANVSTFFELFTTHFFTNSQKRSRDHPAAPLCIRGYSICRGQTALTAFRKKLVKSKEWQSVWCQWSSWFRIWLFLTTCHNSGKKIFCWSSDILRRPQIFEKISKPFLNLQKVRKSHHFLLSLITPKNQRYFSNFCPIL